MADSAIGGVPVDSEYIMFIMDTSGSMGQGAWGLVLKKSGRSWKYTRVIDEKTGRGQWRQFCRTQ